MNKSDAVAHFGSQEKLAKSLGLTQGAVSQWPALVPLGHALHVEKITHGTLAVDLALYEGKKTQAAQ